MDIMKPLVIVLLFTSLVFCHSGLEANEDSRALTFNSMDRILVIAPHPDDETIGAAGVIQEAVRLNIPVRVMYVTNGDSNSLAFLYYKKYPVLSKRQAIEMGKLRQKEASEAAGHLGLKEDQIIFLGYPDFGTLKMFKAYWNPSQAYRGTLTKSKRVPYQETLTPGALYNAMNILEDFKKTLLDFKPTAVFVTHPADMNEDHQAAYLFLKIALWDLHGQMNDVSIYTYFIHAIDWPRPLGYFPTLRMEYSPHLLFTDSQWGNFELSAGQIERKKSAIEMYRTQIPYKPNFLFSYVRINEPFAQLAETKLITETLNDEVWKRLAELQATCLSGGCLSDRRSRYLKSVVYGLTKESLNIRTKLNQPTKDLKIEMNIFGYRQGVAFDQMPKLRVVLDREFSPVIRDAKEYRRVTGVNVLRKGNDVFVSIPLKSLGDPDKVIASAGIWVNGIPLESSAWTFLELDHGS